MSPDISTGLSAELCFEEHFVRRGGGQTVEAALLADHSARRFPALDPNLHPNTDITCCRTRYEEKARDYNLRSKKNHVIST